MIPHVPIPKRHASDDELADVLAWSVELHLATLEQLCERKSSSKSDIRRQQDICDRLIDELRLLGVGSQGRNRENCTRVEARLNALQARLHGTP